MNLDLIVGHSLPVLSECSAVVTYHDGNDWRVSAAVLATGSSTLGGREHAALMT
jgi:hypothetical protein